MRCSASPVLAPRDDTHTAATWSQWPWARAGPASELLARESGRGTLARRPSPSNSERRVQRAPASHSFTHSEQTPLSLHALCPPSLLRRPIAPRILLLASQQTTKPTSHAARRRSLLCCIRPLWTGIGRGIRCAARCTLPLAAEFHRGDQRARQCSAAAAVQLWLVSSLGSTMHATALHADCAAGR